MCPGQDQRESNRIIGSCQIVYGADKGLAFYSNQTRRLKRGLNREMMGSDYL